MSGTGSPNQGNLGSESGRARDWLGQRLYIDLWLGQRFSVKGFGKFHILLEAVAGVAGGGGGGGGGGGHMSPGAGIGGRQNRPKIIISIT